MPNWCQNVLTLTHENPEAIKRAEAAFVEGKFLNEFIPVPEELTNPDTTTHSGDDPEKYDKLREQLLDKYGYNSWYDSCITEWGTKWDVGESHGINEVSENSLSVYFDSAWSPPIAAYEKLSDLIGFKVEAYYCEEGVGFCGKWTTEGAEEEYEIPSTSKEIREKIPADLDDMFCLSENREISEEEEAYDSEDQ